MTSNVKIKNNNFPVRVETLDGGVIANTEIVLVGDEIENRDWYITTTREVRFIDLDNNAPEVVAELEKRRAANAASQPAEDPGPVAETASEPVSEALAIADPAPADNAGEVAAA